MTTVHPDRQTDQPESKRANRRARRLARRRSSWAMGALAAGIMTVVAAGCSTPAQVPWESYAPNLQDQIDSAAQDQNCDKLSTLHDQAKKTSSSHESATGIPNDALIDYINEAALGAGCHI